MFQKFTIKIAVVLAATSMFLTSCVKNPTPTSDEAKTYDNSVALKWNNLYLEVERSSAAKYRPPQSARVLAYIGMAEYEALIQGMPSHNSLASRYQTLNIPQIEQGAVYHWPSVYNAVYASLMKKFFPTDPVKVIDAANLYKIYAMETELHNKYKGAFPEDVINRSEAYGVSVANAVYAYSSTDPIGHESYNKITDPNYVAPTGLGLWKGNGSTTAMGPSWGKCRMFAAVEADRQSGVPPIPYSEDINSKYYQQANEVRIAVNDIRAGKDYEGRWIAEFWGDDMAGATFTPAARLLAILSQVIEKDNSNLDKAVLAYAKMGIALNDAGVCCWALKYKYNIERPDEYINRVMDKNWKPIMGEFLLGVNKGVVPPFPAYPSGHSTFGSVGAEVMANVFGYNFEITDRCHVDRKDFIGTPRTFRNFYDLGLEDAYSRIPLGVHWRMDCEEGIRVGNLVGRRVNALPWNK